MRRRIKTLLARLRTGTVFETRDYRESELARLANLFAHVDLERWRGLRVLEVGAGPGRIGEALRVLGHDVTSTDGRRELVARLPTGSFVLDLDNDDLAVFGQYDVILSFGVLYHLADPARFLRAAGLAQWLALSTVVSDSIAPVCPLVKEARGLRGQDQALQGRACRPSPAWVEDELRKAGFTEVMDISTALANWSTSVFDWTPHDDGAWKRDGAHLRRMWIAHR